jgi:hypothetical protein
VRPLKSGALLVLLSVLAIEGTAGERSLELQLQGGATSATRLAGCCSSAGTQASVLGITRFEGLASWPAVEIAASSSGRWSAFSAGPSYYFVGGPLEKDPSSSEDLSVVRVSDWAATASFGLGMGVHSARTIDFDLPVLVVSFLTYARVQLRYAWDERWTILLTGEGAAAATGNYFMLVPSLHLGTGYRF